MSTQAHLQTDTHHHTHYREHVRPWLGELLHTLRLDKVYQRAAGNYLYARQADGEQAVLDLIGGYGANFFGHHEPRLQQCLLELLQAQVPFHAQGSIRPYAARLAKALSDKVGAWTGQRYVVTFSNTGAEATEAALKHAQMVYQQRCQQFLSANQRRALQLLASLPAEAATALPPPSLELLASHGYSGPPEPTALLAFVQQHNQQQDRKSVV